MASEIDEQRLVLIEQRLGETERAQRRIDWAIWSGRLTTSAAFTLAMLAVVLAPFSDFSWGVAAGNGLIITAFVVLYNFYLWRFRPDLFKEGRKQLLFASSVLLCAIGTRVAIYNSDLDDLSYK